MPATTPESDTASADRRWMATYGAAVVAFFTPLYLLTRLPLWVSDSATFIDEARRADPRRALYGYPGHFLQMPLTHGLWQLLNAAGVPVSVEAVWFGLCLAGTLAAIFFLGLIAADVLRAPRAAWLAGLLFGTSLNMWWQWNGELYALALGFLTAGVFLACRRHLVAAACLWALSVACHIDLVLAGPIFVLAVWMSRPSGETAGTAMRRAAQLLVIAGGLSLATFLGLMWTMGKWKNGADLAQLAGVWQGRLASSGHVLLTPEIFRASKGLLTAYTVAGHYWRDILTGRGLHDDPLFVLASAVGLIVLLGTFVVLAAAARSGRAAMFALVWLLPFEVGFNWWFVPNDSKYHAGALAGLILLLTAGLLRITAKMPRSARSTICATYIVACAGLNLFGSILPMRTRGAETIAATVSVRRLNDEGGGRAVFVSCTDSEILANAGVDNVRVKHEWKGDSQRTQDAIRSAIHARAGEGSRLFLLDRWCRPDEWFVPPPPPFDLYFLQRDFEIVPTSIVNVPVARVWEANPFSWRRGDLFRLVPKY